MQVFVREARSPIASALGSSPLLLAVMCASQALCGVPVNIPSSDIGLPTNGASIYSVVLVNAGDPGNYNGTFYRVNGAIHPINPNSPKINFQVNLPARWNGRLVQLGGGGFNGILVTGEGFPICLTPEDKRPLAQGYVTFGSDSGHYSTGWDGKWGLDDEALVNFAADQLKKTRDAAVKIATEFYGRTPEHVYFIGDSNGGREALKAVQLFPEDYDGAVSFYPVLNWTAKALHDNYNADKMQGEGWFGREEYNVVRDVIVEMCDESDGLKDDIISNPFTAEKARDEIFAALAEKLTPQQLEVLKSFHTPLTLGFTMPNGAAVVPGYLLSQRLSDGGYSQMSSSREKRDGSMQKFGGQVIQYQIVRGANFNPANFKPEEWQKEILAASELLDAANPDLSRFQARGGKLMMFHGGADQFVSLQETINYYNALRGKFGEGLGGFVRFWYVPGYGHGRGDLFTLNRDILADLDAWVSNGEAPDVLVVKDKNNDRSRPLYQFPQYAKYKEGDPDKAESFEPASLYE